MEEDIFKAFNYIVECAYLQITSCIFAFFDSLSNIAITYAPCGIQEYANFLSDVEQDVLSVHQAHFLQMLYQIDKLTQLIGGDTTDTPFCGNQSSSFYHTIPKN